MFKLSHTIRDIRFITEVIRDIQKIFMYYMQKVIGFLILTYTSSP